MRTQDLTTRTNQMMYFDGLVCALSSRVVRSWVRVVVAHGHRGTHTLLWSVAFLENSRTHFFRQKMPRKASRLIVMIVLIWDRSGIIERPLHLLRHGAPKVTQQHRCLQIIVGGQGWCRRRGGGRAGGCTGCQGRVVYAPGWGSVVSLRAGGLSLEQRRQRRTMPDNGELAGGTGRCGSG